MSDLERTKERVIYTHDNIQSLLSSSAKETYPGSVDLAWRSNISKSIENLPTNNAQSTMGSRALVASIAAALAIVYLLSNWNTLLPMESSKDHSATLVAGVVDQTKRDRVKPSDREVDLLSQPPAPLTAEYNALLNDLEKIKSRIIQI